MNGTRRSKLAAISVAAATSAIGLSAMAGTAAASSSTVTFTYWTSFFKSSWIAAIDKAFDASHPG